MGLTDPCMPSMPVQSRNFVLACYAVSLIQGESILAKHIRSKTVKLYIKAAKALFRQRQLPTTPTLDTDYIKVIIHTHERYENVPKRRNMISDGMMHWLKKNQAKHDQDDALPAVVDWLVLGRYTGHRKSEWCNDSQSKYEKIDHWPGQPALAFIHSDFTFLDKYERTAEVTLTTNPTDIHYVNIQWRKQKNGDNGAEITFGSDYKNPPFCPVQAAVSIVQRSLRLGNPHDEPLAVYKNKKGKRKFISSSMVETHLRKAASTVHNIPPKDPYLKQWSTHSIRVTAANLLHRERFSDSFIQKRLRWKSTSFLDYLRNTIYAADQHAGLKLSPANLPPMEERTYREDEPHDYILNAIAAAAA